MDYINSFPELGVEFELPFYLRSIGYDKNSFNKEFPNGHIRHHIVIILDGQCVLKAGTYTYHLKKNDGFFMRAHFPFSYYSITKDCKAWWVVFDGYATIPLFSRLGLENYMIYHNLDTFNLSMTFSKMYITSIKTDVESRLQNSAMTYKLLIDVHTQYREENENLDIELPSNLLYSKRFIDQFYAQDMTQEQIANAAAITPQHLCRLFKKYLNKTPTEYLNSVRIEHAKYLLRTTTLPIIEIGERVGYSTSHYFSSTFSKFEGKTPSEYRKLANIAAQH